MNFLHFALLPLPLVIEADEMGAGPTGSYAMGSGAAGEAGAARHGYCDACAGASRVLASGMPVTHATPLPVRDTG